MKKLNVLTRMLLLVALLVGSVGSAWGDTTKSVTLSGGSISGGVITWTTADGGHITVQQTQGSSSTAVNGSYISAPRVYKGHILSFTAATGYKIKSISITCNGANLGNSMTAGTALSGTTVTDNITDVERTWASTSGGTHVVSSKNAAGLSQIYIQNVASSENVQLRPTTISITYSTAYAITAVSNDEKMGTVSGTTTITASPKDGYRVKAGSEGYTVTSGSATVTNNDDNTFTVSPTSDCTVRINFEAIPVHTLSSAINTVGAGTVTLGSTSIREGLTTTATAAANAGFKFTGWSISGAGASLSSTSENPTTVTMGTSDATITANFKAVTTYAISWSVNGEIINTDNVEEYTDITFPDNISDIDGKKFLGWSASTIDGIITTEPSFVSSATSTSDRTYYAVFGEVVENIPASWTLTDLSDMESSDIFVFSNGTYAMNNDNGTSDAPATNSITVSANKITSEVADNLKWNVSGDAENGYTFYPNGVTEKWLYCNTPAASGSNNNIRVGTGDRKKWVFDTNGYLVTNDTYTKRYLSIYNNQNFRGYTNTENGVFVPKFYKYIAASEVYGNWRTTATVPVTISDAKYATFASDYDLDFSETDVKAYKAKVDKNKVVLTQVDYVPANTGVILYCATAKDYDVPVISNAAAVSDNEMVGVTVETTVKWNPSTNVYNYILQHGVFKKAAEEGAKLRANRAYLSTAYNVTAPGSKPLTIVFNDDEQGEETDGIKAVSTTVENGVRYNLAGQRVGNDYKGIVVVNGKKMLNK